MFVGARMALLARHILLGAVSRLIGNRGQCEQRSGSKQRAAVVTMRRWVDWVNVMFGVWLIASPWFLTVTDKPAAWSSWIVGAGIVSLAFFSMYKPAVWGDTLAIMA